jgi:hypothetical protein
VVVQPHKQIVLRQSDYGIYYHNTINRTMVIVNTVDNNREGFTNCAYNKDKQARRALGMVGYPSERDFCNIVSSNMIINCPVTPTDINAAKQNFGPNIASLKGKTVRFAQEPILTSYVKVPQEIIDLNKEITIAAEVMFIHGMGFMITGSRGVKFTTSEYVPTRSKADLINSLKKVFEIYTQRGFTIQTALMDKEFEFIRDDLHGITLNTNVAREHVPETERHIRVIKERVRAIWSTLPLNRVPSKMIVELINFVVVWINVLPHQSGYRRHIAPHDHDWDYTRLQKTL